MALDRPPTRGDRALARYLELEDLAAVEALLTVHGATVDARLLPFLTARLAEEEATGARCAARGYARMAEKSAQLVGSLRDLMRALEEAVDAPLPG